MKRKLGEKDLFAFDNLTDPRPSALKEFLSSSPANTDSIVHAVIAVPNIENPIAPKIEKIKKIPNGISKLANILEANSASSTTTACISESFQNLIVIVFFNV